MGVKSKINQSELRKWLKNGVENELHKRILRNLNHLGMQCITIAKSLDTYQDRTGNLRNSIGYLILKDGQMIDSSFESGEGGENGKKHAEKVSKNYPEGYALIVVAGMEYAGYVEYVHDLPVLAPAENFAKGKAEQIMKNIIAKFE